MSSAQSGARGAVFAAKFIANLGGRDPAAMSPIDLAGCYTNASAYVALAFSAEIYAKLLTHPRWFEMAPLLREGVMGEGIGIYFKYVPPGAAVPCRVCHDPVKGAARAAFVAWPVEAGRSGLHEGPWCSSCSEMARKLAADCDETEPEGLR